MGDAPHDQRVIRLTVPARDDFVSVLRATVRMVAGRAGCSDDVRSRLQAAAGQAFFALLDTAPAGTSVRTVVHPEDHSVTLDLTPTDPAALANASSLAGLGDGHEVIDGGRTLRLWVRG